MDTLLLNSDAQPLSYVPISVVTWQVAMRLLTTYKVSVLKSYDDWFVRSQYLEMPVPSIVMCTKQVKWKKQLKYSSSNIFLRDNFTCQLQITGRCRAVAGKVKLSELTLDHIVPRSYGGKTNWLNCCTACKECNSSKGNNKDILPKKMPNKPTYHEILSRRKQFPVYIKDPEWKFYIDWPEELVRLIPHGHGKTTPQLDIDSNAKFDDKKL